MSAYTIYGIPNCPNCDTAKRIAKENDVEVKYVDLTTDESLLSKIQSLGIRSMPAVFTGTVDDGNHIGNHESFRQKVMMSLDF